MPEGAEEGTPEAEPVPVYTYNYGEERRSDAMREMYVELVARGVGMLVDPMHLEDKVSGGEMSGPDCLIVLRLVSSNTFDLSHPHSSVKHCDAPSHIVLCSTRQCPTEPITGHVVPS